MMMMKELENEPERDDTHQGEMEPLPDRNPEWEDRSGHDKIREREHKDDRTREQ